MDTTSHPNAYLFAQPNHSTPYPQTPPKSSPPTKSSRLISIPTIPIRASTRAF
ncbi:hypothetical protein BofuT4_uP036590.1 [Botrytis cinerea T4]|uniref:Uncharacterized protein n=1 Tax=Botryotinia fuckeliana (strain T4) TaxID=999810 RepID=G2Y4T9_BOTF4|nr:hypothetical protein BofuT4_uP036590.1 [Botrytis cinerea T4]